jgi:hypothetical protein
MSSFLIDNSTLIYIFLAILFIASAVFWWRHQRPANLIAPAALLCLIAALWTIGHFVDTDSKQIERAVQEMRAGVKTRDLNRIFENITNDFHYSGFNRDTFRSKADAAMRDWNVEDVIVWDFEADSISRQTRSAQVTFKVKAKGNWRGSEAFYLCRADFVLDPDGKWRLRGFRLFNPYVNTTQEVGVPGL